MSNTVIAQNNRELLLNKLNTLLNTNTVQAKDSLLKEAEKLEFSKVEEDLILANKIYKELGEEKQYDKLTKAILSKFPKGITARQQAADYFLKKMQEMPTSWIEQQYASWLKNFPKKEFESKNQGTYDMVLMQVIKHFLSTGQHHLVDKYKNNFIDRSLKTMTYYSIAENYFKNENIKSKFHIDSALVWSDDARQSTDMKIRSSFGAMMYNNIALLTAQIDLKSGNPETAIKLLPDILYKTKYQPMHGENMVTTLAEAYVMTEANLEAFQVLKNYAIKNEDVDKIWDNIAVLYKKLNGDDGNYSIFKEDIENEKNEKHIQSLKAKLINKKVPNFKLLNLQGNTVSLEDFKDKIVIIDFWATWCVPCIRSFPAMQQLANEFRNSKDVVFLFINTWEKQKNYKESVQKLITDNNYTFNVLYDEVSATQNILLATQLEVPSLPTKILVDKNGFMRIMNSGSEMNDKAIIKEVKNLIKIGREL